MKYQHILYKEEHAVATLTINRPDKLNALNKSTLHELHHALQRALESPQVAGILLTGSGQKAFVAGADIQELSGLQPAQGAELARQGQELVFNAIENSPKPTLALINGYALGGGLELALSCHLRIAYETAKMGLPEVSLGLIPGYGGTQRLPQLVGKAFAMELILTGEMIEASKALSLGLVNQVVPAEDGMEAALAMLKKINQNSRSAISQAIAAVNSFSQENGYEIEIESFSNCFATADFKEGVQAFIEKRKPRFPSH